MTKGKNNPFFDKRHNEETKQLMSKNRKGKCLGKDNHNFGKHLSKKTKEKISKKMSGVKNPSAKLTWEKVREIREKYKSRLYSQRKLAKEYDVSQCAIFRIIQNKTWKEEIKNV